MSTGMTGKKKEDTQKTLAKMLGWSAYSGTRRTGILPQAAETQNELGTTADGGKGCPRVY